MEFDLGTYVLNLRWVCLVLGLLLVVSLLVNVFQRIVIKRRERSLSRLKERLVDVQLEAGYRYGTGPLKGFLMRPVKPPPPPVSRPSDPPS